jgi:hypothetical protein
MQVCTHTCAWRDAARNADAACGPNESMHCEQTDLCMLTTCFYKDYLKRNTIDAVTAFIELPYCASQSKRAKSAAVQQGQKP